MDSRAHSTSAARRRLVLEPLEQRLLLDGNVIVAVSGSDVYIFGDGASNNIGLGRIGDQLVVVGSTTSVNGVLNGSFYVPLPVRNINIVMNEGDDVVTVGTLPFRGSLNYDGGTGNDNLAVGNCTFGGGLNLTGGLGNDQFSIGSDGIAGSVLINTGAGEDDVAIGSVGIGGNLQVTSTHGELNAAVGSVGIRGSTMVSGGNGDLQVAIGVVNMGGSLTVQTADYMIASLGGLIVRNGISIMGGRWDTQVNVGDVDTTNLTIGTGPALAGETPLLDVSIGDVGLAGSLQVSAGQEFAGQVVVTELRARGAVQVAWENADGAPIAVGMEDVVAGGNVGIAGNSGQFGVELLNVASGGSIGIQGNFLTEVDAEDLLARGNLNVDFGPGLLDLELDNSVFGGNLNVTGAGGIEMMQIKHVGVRGNANVSTGDGSVQALLSSLHVGGSLNVTNGAGASAAYAIGETLVRGNLNVQSSALYTGLELVVVVGGNVNVQTGLAGDDIWFHHSTVYGRTTVNTDGGNDQFIMGNSLLNGSVLVDAGSGQDEVWFAHDGSDPSGAPLVFNSSVTVRTQGDNDSVAIGLSPSSGDTAKFYGPVFMDGGSGIDALFLAGFNTYSQVPTFVSFEIV